MAEFIDCTSLSISFNVMGIATISYTIVSDTAGFKAYDTIDAGGQKFHGYVASITLNQIPGSSGWFESHVTLIATTD